jgi:MFS family permease
VTFSDLFADREFRSLYLAGVLSWLGDYLARAAITVLVYQETSSVLLSAVSFALSYLPWIVGGPVLAALAERYPYRRVMILCDVVRMVLFALIVIPGLPVGWVIALLLAAALAGPPAQAAKSALLPLILPADRLVAGLAVNSSSNQAAQVVGYLAGATIAAAYSPGVAIAVNAAMFGISALLIAHGIRERPAARDAGRRTHLLRETAEGFQVVFGDRSLRRVAVLVFSLMLFAIVPEGLAAAWAAEAGPPGGARGPAQGMIMAAGPVGFILGGLVIGRFVAPARRPALIRPLAVLAPLALVPALADPPPPVIALMALVTGFAVAGLLPVLNGMFVLALPHGYRARAFGVMQGGMQVTQGAAVLITGLLAERFGVPVVVGAWSIGGTLLMLLVAVRRSDVEALDATVAPPGAAMPGATRVTPAPGPDVMSPPPAAGRMER